MMDYISDLSSLSRIEFTTAAPVANSSPARLLGNLDNLIIIFALRRKDSASLAFDYDVSSVSARSPLGAAVLCARVTNALCY